MVSKFEESQRLNRISSEIFYGHGVNGIMIQYCTNKILKFLVPGSVLELGPAEGVSTKILAKQIDDLEVVDASELYVAKIRSSLPGVTCLISLFEEFCTPRRFDNIIMGHILEHVESPEQIVSKYSQYLKPGGRVIVSVPNANSIHRTIGVAMKILSSKNALNENDIRIGHRRVFDKQELESLFGIERFSIVESSGFFLKTMSNYQMENIWSQEVIKMLMPLGEAIPDMAAELFLVAALKP